MSTRAKKAGKATKAATERKPAPAKPVPAGPPAQPDKQVSIGTQMALHPTSNAAAIMLEYGKTFGEQEMEPLMNSLHDATNGMLGGDMKRAETMLFAQAHSLQSIFMNFSRQALVQNRMGHLESYLRMALKAQNQCRMTLETLATVKNPPVVFARQANINNGGQQQVNNGTAQPNSTPTHAAKPAAAQNELLEASDGERLDTGAAGATSGADPHLETVAAVHRPAHG